MKDKLLEHSREVSHTGHYNKESLKIYINYSSKSQLLFMICLFYVKTVKK